MIVILAEKPAQAKEYAKVFSNVKSENGFIKVQDNNLLSGQEVIITWAIGHLLELYLPENYNENWKTWSLSNLPILPIKFKFNIKKEVSGQFNIVQKILNTASEIIIATDPDREGENIAQSIITYLNINKSIKRLWINSLEIDEIIRGLNNLKNGEETYPLYIEAKTRQIADWLVGLNFTRLYSMLFDKHNVKEIFSIGRVQTPTLMLIYNRENEIKNFKPKKYYVNKIICTTKNNEKFIATENERYDQENEIQKISNSTGTITNLTKELKQTSASKLYNLTSLQQKANSQLKYSSDKTLQIVQSLYQKKYLSYPRTDCKLITTDVFDYLLKNYNSYKQYYPSSELINNKPNKKFVNDKKVLEHYAIVPTKQTPKLSSLNEEEKNIYLLVIKSILAMFEDDYYYEQTIVEVNHTFYTTGNMDKKLGWKKLFKEKVDDNEKLPSLEINEGVNIEQKIEDKFTQPPKLHTEATLLKLMDNVHSLTENEDLKSTLKEVKGIGTPATRSNIIETLKKRNYISFDTDNKKSQSLICTEKGKLLCYLILSTNKLLGSPEMTAEWETKLKEISLNNFSDDIFLNGINNFITQSIQQTPEKFNTFISKINISNLQNNSANKKEVIMKCINCSDGQIIKVNHPKFKGYTCDKKCGLKPIFNSALKKFGKNNITINEAQALYNKQKIKVKLTTSKTKKSYYALAYLDFDSGFVKIDFNN